MPFSNTCSLKYRSRVLSVIMTCGITLLRVMDAVYADDPPPIPDDLVVKYNLAYREGASDSWKLDLAMPKESTGQLRPGIVIIHGGGWIEGSRSSFSSPQSNQPAHIVEFAKLGFVAVSIDYRLSREAPYPAAIEDCKCAVRWLRAHSQEFELDRERIGTWGNSAGGHLALVLGLVDQTAGLEGDGPNQDQSSLVQAVVSDSGPIELTYQYEHQQVQHVIGMFMGGPPTGDRLKDYEIASPSSYVSAKAPPLLLIYGEADSQVGVETSDRFVDALQQAGARDVNYLRLGAVDHCPHSIQRVPWLVPAVNEFLIRTLKPGRQFH